MYLPTSAAHMLAMDVLAFDKMKSNRRKQSKPIRVSYSAENVPSLESGMPYPSHVSKEDMTHERSNGKIVSDPEQEEELTSSKLPSQPSSQKSPSPRDEISPSTEEKQSSPLKLCPKENNNEQFPTKYHRLGSELLQSNAFVPNGNGETNNNHNGFTLEDAESPSSKDISADEEGRKLDGSSRIFHQDAYCELCDREFCNKYFLKTHKANKHGIFDNSPSPFSMGAIGSGMSLPQDINVSSSSVTSPSSIPLPPPAISSMSSFKVMDFIQNLPASEPKLPKSEFSTPSKSDSLPATPTSSSNNTQTSSSANKVSKDMEDFCELCQKHFCNKYYLKKHKQDVHGIAPPDGSSANKRGRPKDLQAQFGAISSGAATSNSPLIPHSLPSMAGLPNMPGVMVLNPFMAPMLIPAGSLLPGSQIPTPPIMSQALTVSSNSDSISTSASPSVGQSGSTESRGGGAGGGSGVLNAEAYCELCRKEFCNKYFLKIHKANKHGVFMDDLPMIPGMPPFKFPMCELTANTSEKLATSLANMEEAKDLTKSETSPKPAVSLISNSTSPENAVTYCGLCNQEFASKYTYRIHRIQVHGMLNEGFDASVTEEIIKNSFREREEFFRNALREKEEVSKFSPGSRCSDDKNVDTKMAENGMTTMFGNMVAAKLADRVTCEVCNKDLCNKYFLKVHKFKVHGIDTSTPDNRFDPSKISKSQLTGDFELIKSAVKQEPRDLSHHSPKVSSMLSNFPKPGEIHRDNSISPSLNVEKPSNEELVKMGIDPEAYCEICKKEFCSKYFLRTHRQNIHGISSDKPDTPNQDKTPIMSSLSALPQSNNMPLNLCTSSSKKAKPGFEKQTWRWKEPANSSRVTCEICNKELCNKYFMRTHKLNKHGILPSESSLSPSTSDIETTSNSSFPTDLSTHDRNNQSPQAVKLDSNLPHLNSEDKPPNKQIGDYQDFKMSSEEEMNNRYFNHYSEVCHLCDRRFKSMKWLNAHIIKDHGGMRSFSTDFRNKMLSAGFDMPSDQKTCRICDAVFPTELSMHLHMIQEHNAQVSLNTEEKAKPKPQKKIMFGSSPKFSLKKRYSFIAKQKLYNCALCDYKSKWMNNVYMHELKEHRVSHRRNKVPYSDNQDIVNMSSKKYRCAKCNLKFASPVLCQLHIREDHIRGKNFRVNKKLPNTRFSCKFCRFSTRFSKQLRHHVTRVHNDGRYIASEVSNGFSMGDNISGKRNTVEQHIFHAEAMDDPDSTTVQAFQIKDCSLDSEFPLSTIRIPVRHRVNGPVTVTFHLAPMEQ